jgi:hypothetical protein
MATAGAAIGSLRAAAEAIAAAAEPRQLADTTAAQQCDPAAEPVPTTGVTMPQARVPAWRIRRLVPQLRTQAHLMPQPHVVAADIPAAVAVDMKAAVTSNRHLHWAATL